MLRTHAARRVCLFLQTYLGCSCVRQVSDQQFGGAVKNGICEKAECDEFVYYLLGFAAFNVFTSMSRVGGLILQLRCGGGQSGGGGYLNLSKIYLSILRATAALFCCSVRPNFEAKWCAWDFALVKMVLI